MGTRPSRSRNFRTGCERLISVATRCGPACSASRRTRTGCLGTRSAGSPADCPLRRSPTSTTSGATTASTTWTSWSSTTTWAGRGTSRRTRRSRPSRARRRSATGSSPSRSTTWTRTSRAWRRSWPARCASGWEARSATPSPSRCSRTASPRCPWTSSAWPRLRARVTTTTTTTTTMTTTMTTSPHPRRRAACSSSTSVRPTRPSVVDQPLPTLNGDLFDGGRGAPVDFVAEAFDVGTDDLAFFWSWGSLNDIAYNPLQSASVYTIHVFHNNAGPRTDGALAGPQSLGYSEAYFDRGANTGRTPFGTTDFRVRDSAFHAFGNGGWGDDDDDDDDDDDWGGGSSSSQHLYYVVLIVLDDDNTRAYPSSFAPNDGVDMQFL